MAKNTAVFGIHPNRTIVSDAMDVLRQAGYRNTDIAVLLPDNQGPKDFAHEKSTKAPEGAATGAATGAALGAVLAWLVAVGVFRIPNLTPFLTAGPMMAALAGAGSGGALGWLIGFLAGLGLPEYEAKRYSGRIMNKGILLSVHCDSSEWCDRAKKTLKDTGAQSISSASESVADHATTGRPAERALAGFGNRGEAH